MENNEINIDRDTLVGTFINNKSFGFVIPNDRKIKQDIFISKKDFNGARNNQKVVLPELQTLSQGREMLQ